MPLVGKVATRIESMMRAEKHQVPCSAGAFLGPHGFDVAEYLQLGRGMPTAQQVGLTALWACRVLVGLCPCSSYCGTGYILHLLAHIADPATTLLWRQAGCRS